LNELVGEEVCDYYVIEEQHEQVQMAFDEDYVADD
jgi:hypothetical protein